MRLFPPKRFVYFFIAETYIPVPPAEFMVTITAVFAFVHPLRTNTVKNMAILFTAYFFLYFLSGMILLIPTLFLWQRRNIAGISPLFLTMFFMSAMLFLGAGENLFVDFSVKKVFLIFEDITYSACITAMLFFVMEYFFGNHWLYTDVRRYLWVGLALFLLFEATNAWHGLVWVSYTKGPAGSNTMYAQPGPLYMGIITIMDLVGVFMLGALGLYAVRHHGWERRRAFYILMGMSIHFLAPVLMLSVSDLNLSAEILPVMYATAGLLISWVVFEDQHRLLMEKTRDLQQAHQELALKLNNLSKKMAGLFEIILMGSQQMQNEEIAAALLSKISSLMDGAAVCLYNKAGTQFQLADNFGLLASQIEGVTRIPTAWLPETTETRITEDSALDSELPAEFKLAGFRAQLARWINTGETPPHVLMVLWSQPRQFTVEELSLVNAITDEARVIFDNTRLRKISIDQALLQQRYRISRDLHDTITQSLNSLVLTSEVAGAMAEKSNIEKLRKIISSLQVEARQAQKELRLLLFELRAEAPGKKSFWDALQSRINLVEKKAGVNVKMAGTGWQDCPAYVTEELYYIAMEALNNSLKHAFATQVEIELEMESQQIILKVQDDGCGFQLNSANRGLGLRGMTERAARMGGNLEIESAAGKGTLIKATLPLAF
jgi:signal transduction histidine kinase